MGKRILAQRKGRGTPTFRSPVHKKLGPVRYLEIHRALREGDGILRAKILDLQHEPGRGAPVAILALENGRKTLYLPPEGAYVGQVIEIGPKAEPAPGNVLPLEAIPDGTPVYNIEVRPGDGGKLVRASGTYALVIAHEETGVRIQLPSGKTKVLNPKCMATIGVVAGGGRTEKPFYKAGRKYHLSKAKAWKWPTVRGVAMSPYAHPHGGGSHQHLGKPSTVPRGAPPGRKVGHIAARKTGRGKKRR